MYQLLYYFSFLLLFFFFFFQAEDGIRDDLVTGVQTCALPIYGQHMGSLLLDSLDKTGIAYRAVSGTRAYKEGLFNEQIDKILRNAARVGQIIKETLGQEKYTETLPYFPVCKNCGRIYTTKALEYIPERHVVKYVCEGMQLRAGTLQGCGHHGEVDVRSGDGKLSWKV